jgi:NAD(P)-dependent dehydrogenase (short-subunit alcohol dehydrogenase family)
MNAMPETVIVTGAASGIGKACALMCLKEGREVIALDRKEADLAKALPKGEARLELVAADVSQTADCAAAVERAVKRFGKLDALIHWAATHSTKHWTELTAEEFNRVLGINVTGSFLIAQAAARHMQPRKKGAIVLCASTSVLHGSIGGGPGNGGPAYVTSKAAITGLTRTLSRALAPDGIRVNAVAPGVTETPMIATYTPEARAMQKARVPTGKLAEPDEIASVGCFLITEGARYINGEVIIVNGAAAFG